MAQKRMSSGSLPPQSPDKDNLILSDDDFWKEAGKLADGHHRSKRLRLLGAPENLVLDKTSPSNRNDAELPKTFSERDKPDEQLEKPRRPKAWWEGLDPETFAIVRDRLGPDFHFGMDDPARAWKPVPPRRFREFPSCLIQIDAHTFVSKRRFVEHVKKHRKTEISPEDIDGFIGKSNVILKTPNGYLSPETLKTTDPGLRKTLMREQGLYEPIGLRSGFLKLPEIIVHADENTFVSGEKLKMKLDSAGVKFGQLLYEEQAFLLNHTISGNQTGNFSVLGLYARGYRKLSKLQREQLNLPENVQSKLPNDRTCSPYRDFTEDLYPRVGERLYPKGSEDFAKELTSGFLNLKETNANWAYAPPEKQALNMRRDLLERKPNAASLVRD